ncbi:ComGF family competence protein [Planococcus sp. ISL-109]|uniref:ComGF family competence protein n=1 Tax=Planococcus sp. ISL-109 TaxID=2819166 RepID=UPI001BEB15F8|nr:ComGF family competence protein [Planococcus sp. ISL-109]MBT2582294.1 ComGF family competence protein [Planococcus sp. ISL-109]
MLKMMRSKRGFTFVDSLLNIVALSLVLPLAAMFYLYSMQFLSDMDSSATEFRLFTLELQRYLAGSEQVHIMRSGQGLRIYQSGTVYDIEMYGAVVRKRKDLLGHEIMLTEVAAGGFAIDGKTLTISMEFESGAAEEVGYELSLP